MIPGSSCGHWLGAESRQCGSTTDVRPYLVGDRCHLHAPGGPVPARPAVTVAPGRPTGVDPTWLRIATAFAAKVAAGGRVRLPDWPDIPPCTMRDDLEQGYRPECLQAACVKCGRVTARRDHDGVPWCGGATVALKANAPDWRPSLSAQSESTRDAA